MPVHVGQRYQRYLAMGAGLVQVVIEAGPAEQGQHGAFGSRPEQFPDVHEPAEICSVTRGSSFHSATRSNRVAGLASEFGIFVLHYIVIQYV